MHSTDEVIWFGQGMVKEPMEDVAELKAVLGGLQKAHDNGLLDLVLCSKPELLQQVPTSILCQHVRCMHADHMQQTCHVVRSRAVQAKVAPAMAAYTGCKLPCNTTEVSVTACCMGVC